jgi:hypothetical protein
MSSEKAVLAGWNVKLRGVLCNFARTSAKKVDRFVNLAEKNVQNELWKNSC